MIHLCQFKLLLSIIMKLHSLAFLAFAFLLTQPVNAQQDQLAKVQTAFVGKWAIDYAGVKPGTKPEGVPDYFFEVKSVRVYEERWKSQHFKFDGSIYDTPIENGHIDFVDGVVSFGFTQSFVSEDAKKTTKSIYYTGLLIDGRLTILQFDPANKDRSLFRFVGEKKKG